MLTDRTLLKDPMKRNTEMSANTDVLLERIEVCRRNLLEVNENHTKEVNAIIDEMQSIHLELSMTKARERTDF